MENSWKTLINQSKSIGICVYVGQNITRDYSIKLLKPGLNIQHGLVHSGSFFSVRVGAWPQTVCSHDLLGFRSPACCCVYVRLVSQSANVS